MAHFDAPSKHLSARPLRLQPSPSLPNLRSAPRDRRPRQMPHPSPRKSSFQLPVSPTEERVLNHSTKEGEDLNDRGHQPRGNHHYLTPPLTPSSSLKSDSSGPECPELCHENKPVPCVDLDLDDATPNRFLIIKNIPIDLLGDNIRYFVNSLATPSSECSAYESTLGSDNLTPNLSIQTIYHRSTDKRTIVVAFYDIRDADRVKHLVDTRNAGKMMEDKAKGKQRAMNGSDVSGRWEETLTCAYIAPKRLLELVGQSASSLMTETEGRFCVSVDHAAFANQDYSSNVNRSRTRFSVPVKMKSILMKHGDFKPIQLLEDSAYKQLYFVEYYDVRDAQSAWKELDKLVIGSITLKLINATSCLRDKRSRPPHNEFQKDGVVADPEVEVGGGFAPEPKTPTATTYLPQSRMHGVRTPVLDEDSAAQSWEGTNPTRMDNASQSANRSVQDSDRQETEFVYPINSCGPSPDADPSFSPMSRSTNITTTDKYGRRGSNHVLFDATKRYTSRSQNTGDAPQCNFYSSDMENSYATIEEVIDVTATPVETPSDSYGNSQIYHTGELYRGADSFPHGPSPVQAPWFSSPHVSPENAMTAQYPMSSPSPFTTPYWEPVTVPAPWHPLTPGHALHDQWSPYPAPAYYYPGATSPPMGEYSYRYFPESSVSAFSSPPAPYPPHYPHAYPQPYPSTHQRPIAEHNQLDIKKIEIGQDTRTTVMVKNIPNKMTDRELISYINKVCPRRIDFLYLRMDFQNGCNVGYAFVNFISVEDLLHFAKQRLNQKWNIYSSEKVLQMSYANYQGKEALVEKFKNSCIMDEREEWRPKIFYSEPGPLQGKPEPFPQPTHMRRKERSSYNRGALFVPGINSTAGHHKTYLNADPPHQRNHPRPQGFTDDRHRRRGGHGQFGVDNDYATVEHTVS